MSVTTVSAPGKVLLLGDYAVLEGAPALIAAVSRRAVGEAGARDAPAPSPVVAAVLEAARAAGFEPPTDIAIDTAAFSDEAGQKLGLGSSAAVAVVTAALATGRGDERTLGVAIEGHRAAAGGRGSGVDVAASFYGGVIAATRQPGPVDPLPSSLPGVHLAVLYTRESASTPDMVSACRASPQWDRWLSVLAPLAREGLEAWRTQAATQLLAVVAQYGRAMAGLGRDAGVPVVTARIAEVMRLAEAAGAAAKPSGAGGGDVAVLFARDPALAARIAEASDTVLLDCAVDPRGLSRRG